MQVKKINHFVDFSLIKFLNILLWLLNMNRLYEISYWISTFYYELILLFQVIIDVLIKFPNHHYSDDHEKLGIVGIWVWTLIWSHYEIHNAHSKLLAYFRWKWLFRCLLAMKIRVQFRYRFIVFQTWVQDR